MCMVFMVFRIGASPPTPPLSAYVHLCHCRPTCPTPPSGHAPLPFADPRTAVTILHLPPIPSPRIPHHLHNAFTTHTNLEPRILNKCSRVTHPPSAYTTHRGPPNTPRTVFTLFHNAYSERLPHPSLPTKPVSFHPTPLPRRRSFAFPTFNTKLISNLKTNVQTGLATDEEVCGRRTLHGWNELTGEEKEALYEKALEQFKDPLILLLLGSAALRWAERQRGEKREEGKRGDMRHEACTIGIRTRRGAYRISSSYNTTTLPLTAHTTPPTLNYTLFSLYLSLVSPRALSLLTGQWDDALSIALAVIIVVTVAFVQECVEREEFVILFTFSVKRGSHAQWEMNIFKLRNEHLHTEK